MLLNSATQKLVCVLTSAKTTNDMPITLNYASTVTAPFSFVGIPVNMFTNGLTPVDPLLLGVTGAQLTVKKLTVYNNDTAAKGYRIGIVDFTTPIVAGSFVAGRPYQITAAGSTNFTLVGAANSTVGTIFNATGVGAGTGTASPFYQEQDVILQVDDVLGYTDTGGWYVNDANGNRKQLAGGVVDLTTNQSIAGVKTFSSPVGVGAAVASGDAVQLSSVSLMPTVASATSPDIFGAAGATINYTGTATATSFAACTAAQVGSMKRIICAGAAVFTASASLIIDGKTSGSTTYTANTILEVVPTSTTVFLLRTVYCEGTWTPTLSSSGGSITSQTPIYGKYVRIGNQVSFSLAVNITNIGTASGYILCTLPFTASPTTGSAAGVENGITGYALAVNISGASLYYFKYDHTFLGANSHTPYINGTYTI